MITDMTRSLEMAETWRLIYWMTIFGHRNGSGGYRIYTGVPGGYRNPPPEVIGPHGPKWWKRRGGQGAAASPSPPPPSPNWTRRGGAAPPFPFPLSPSLSSPSPTRKGGSPTPGGSRTPPGAPPPWPAAPPPLLLYIRGQGAPQRQQLIF